MKPTMKQLVKVVGTAVTLLAVFFIFRKLLASDIDYHLLFTKENVLPAVFAICVQAVIVVTNCLPWRKLVELFAKEKIPFADSVVVYAKANLLKYIPGNVFQYVGRNELALHRKIPHLAVASATFFDVLMTVAAAGLISVIFLFRFIWEFLLKQQQFLIQIGLIGLLLLLVLALLLFFLRTRLRQYLQMYRHLFTWQTVKALLFCLMYYVIVMMISSLMYMCTLVFILDIQVSPALFLQLFSAYTLAWLVGFITPGAPAGIGIKEAVMVGVTGGLISVQSITLSMVVFRVLSTVADFFGFLLALIVKKVGAGRIES